MSKRVSYLVGRLGERPLLLLSLIVIFGGRLIFCLVHFVGRTNGIKFPDLNGPQAAWMMAACIAGVLLVLLWRLMTVNDTIRQHITRQFRKALLQNDADFQIQLRQLVRRLHIRGNFLARIRQIIRLAPWPFCTLVLVLAAGICVCLLAAHFFGGYAEGSWNNYIFANSPWAIATAVFAYLVYNDVWVIDTLIHSSRLLPENRFDSSTRLRAFLEQLDGEELEVFQKRFMENQLVKNVAADLGFSDRTVKTRIKRIREKWFVYCRTEHLHLSLETCIARVKMEAKPG